MHISDKRLTFAAEIKIDINNKNNKTMMVRELSKEQLAQLKQDYFVQRHGENISYDELANIDKLVSDDEVFDYYCDVYFTKEDFF